MTHPMGPTSTGWLAERRPGRCATTVDFCRRHGLVLVRISSTPQTGTPAPPDAGQHAGWIDLHLAGDALPAGIQARVADLALTVIVRPGRVIAAVESRYPVPRLPWYVPASAAPGLSGTGSLTSPPRARRPAAS